MHLYRIFIRTLKKILIWALIILLAIQFTGYVVLQIPAVQTFAIQKITNAASNKIKGKIEIERVHFIFFNKVILQNILIVSTEQNAKLDSLKENFNFSDTLLSCRKLSVAISGADLFKLQLKLKSINLENGVFNLQNEDGESQTNLARIFNIDRNKAKDTTKNGFPINLLANSLKVKDFRFTLNNPYRAVEKEDSIINFSKLNVSDINININNVRIERDTLFGNIKNISATDKSGFKLTKLSGNLQVSAQEARINNLQLADSYTKVNARYFYMKYNSSRDLADFINLVNLGIDLNETYFSFRSIGRITPSLQNSRLGVILSGKIGGPVNDIRSNRLTVKSESGQTLVNLKCRLTGLPDVYQTMSVVDIYDCHTNSQDIAKIISDLNGTEPSGLLKQLAQHVKYNFNGGLIGLPHDFVAHGTVLSNIGEIALDVLLKNDEQQGGFLIQGNAESKNFNIGELLSNKLLGELSMRTSLSALMHKKNGPQLSIDSIKVSKLGFNNYNYSNIFAIGKYNNKIFDGRIICHDPNLDFIFQGLFSFNTTGTNRYNYYADIPYANLAALNLDKRDSVSILKARTIANFTTTSNRDIVGNINILNTTYTNSNGNFNIGTIKLNSVAANNHYNSTLNAPFINATYNGTASITSFVKKVAALTIYDHAGNYFYKNRNNKQSETIKDLLNSKDEYNLSITTFNTGSICELLLPGSYIQDSTRIEAKIDTLNRLDLKLLSGRIALKQHYLKNLNLDINNSDSLLNINLLSDNIRVAGMRLDSSAFVIKGKNNTLDARFSFKNDSTEDNRANLENSIAFYPDSIKFSIKENSFITLKGENWNIKPSSIILADSTISINDFNLNNNGQHLEANGVLKGKVNDSLDVSLNNFDVDIFNLFLNKPFNVEGYFSGKANISTNTGNINMFLDLTGDSVYVHDTPVGVMKIMSKWYAPLERFNLLINSRLNGKSNLTVTGYYKPQDNYINLDGSLDELSVSYFEPFLSDIIAKTNGTFSGNLKLSGQLDKMTLSGENCRFNDFGFIVNYTQVPYTLNGSVTLDEKGVFAKELTVTDRFGNSGRVSGGMLYSYFRNPSLDASVEFRNLECLKTVEKDNEYFYGNAYASGLFSIKGPFNNLKLDINVRPEENSALHIPLSSSSTATQTNLLTFKQYSNTAEDPYEVLMQSLKKEKKADSRMQVKLRANMNTNAEMFIEINKSLGDIIKANGSGNISLDINPSKDVFDVFGDYNINQGNYKFVLSGFGFASKDFTIQPGGVIHFNGDISNTTIDLTATYKTKAAINTLIADTSAVSTRRTVNCEIGMSGQLMNPTLKFNIDIPDLDPTTKVRVESALNTEGKIQKQFAALLISGGFLPDEQSGITNNSTILYSNVSEMLSNQINNILQQLGIPLDLGLNYQPGEKGTTDIFDVAISTQLFNNRLLINGNIGNDPYASSSNNRSVIGNVDVEYKLDKSGRLRLAAFSHAADQYSNYLDDSQRSGFGVSYQQEFNKLRDIFRKKTPEQKEYEKRMKAIQREERKKAASERKAAKKNIVSSESIVE